MDRTSRCTALGIALVLAGCGGGNAQIGGTVSGLASGAMLTLQDSDGDTLAIAANGSFTFATELGADSAYDVTVVAQPLGESCTVTNGEGSVDEMADSVSNVAVSCVATASVLGVVSGLAPGATVTLSDGAQVLSVTVNGAFAFPGLLAPGTAYAVTITTQPAGQACVIADGTGFVSGAPPIPVEVTCS
jgi:hypothetical protein